MYCNSSIKGSQRKGIIIGALKGSQRKGIVIAALEEVKEKVLH